MPLARLRRMKKHENSIATIAVNSAASNMAAEAPRATWRRR